MAKGGKTQKLTTNQTQTSTSALDPAAQQYVNAQRMMAQGAASGLMNGGPLSAGPITPEQITAALSPFLSNVVGGVRGEFDHLRNQAQIATDQGATQAGAFGGSRHALMAGARLGELDRAQASQIGGLLNQGYGQALNFAQIQNQLQTQQNLDPLLRAQGAMGLLNAGMGPYGMTTTGTTNGTTMQPRGGSVMGSALGGASIGSAFGVPGALIGGDIGALGGLLGW